MTLPIERLGWELSVLTDEEFREQVSSLSAMGPATLRCLEQEAMDRWPEITPVQIQELFGHLRR